jgi:hypothetical protein
MTTVKELTLDVIEKEALLLNEIFDEDKLLRASKNLFLDLTRNPIDMLVASWHDKQRKNNVWNNIQAVDENYSNLNYEEYCKQLIDAINTTVTPYPSYNICRRVSNDMYDEGYIICDYNIANKEYSIRIGVNYAEGNLL